MHLSRNSSNSGGQCFSNSGKGWNIQAGEQTKAAGYYWPDMTFGTCLTTMGQTKTSHQVLEVFAQEHMTAADDTPGCWRKRRQGNPMGTTRVGDQRWTRRKYAGTGLHVLRYTPDKLLVMLLLMGRLSQVLRNRAN